MNGVFARRVTLALLAIGILAAAGCGAGDDAGARRGGTVVISTGGDADFLFPPLHAQLQALVVTDLLYEKLADIGPDLNTVGDVGREPRLDIGLGACSPSSREPSFVTQGGTPHARGRSWTPASPRHAVKRH